MMYPTGVTITEEQRVDLASLCLSSPSFKDEAHNVADPTRLSAFDSGMLDLFGDDASVAKHREVPRDNACGWCKEALNINAEWFFLFDQAYCSKRCRIKGCPIEDRDMLMPPRLDLGWF